MSTEMDKLVVAIFNSQGEADAGFEALRDLHAARSITLHDEAVVTKDASGHTKITRDLAPGPVGTAVGLLTGSVIGLPAGPVGVALGATAGTLGGAYADLAGPGVGADVVDIVATRFEPGTWAVLAEVREEQVEPVDARLRAAGATVYRRTRSEIADILIARDTAAIQAEVDGLRSAYDHASGEARADLQGRIDAVRAELRKTRNRTTAELEATRREAEAKIAALKEQAASARTERKEQFDERIAEVQAAYRERAAKLDRAAQLAQEALSPLRLDEDGVLSEGMGAETDGHPAIERVREGNVVVGADGKEIGKVELIRMGDPEALTTRGQERPGTFIGLEGEPDVSEPLRSGLLRLGYVKVGRGGVLGIGERKHYVRSDRIAKVAGDQVVLTVTEAQLPDEQAN